MRFLSFQAPTCTQWQLQTGWQTCSLLHVLDPFSKSFISLLEKGLAKTIHLHCYNTNTSISLSQQIISKNHVELGWKPSLLAKNLFLQKGNTIKQLQMQWRRLGQWPISWAEFVALPNRTSWGLLMPSMNLEKSAPPQEIKPTCKTTAQPENMI